MKCPLLANLDTTELHLMSPKVHVCSTVRSISPILHSVCSWYTSHVCNSVDVSSSSVPICVGKSSTFPVCNSSPMKGVLLILDIAQIIIIRGTKGRHISTTLGYFPTNSHCAHTHTRPPSGPSQSANYCSYEKSIPHFFLCTSGTNITIYDISSNVACHWKWES